MRILYLITKSEIGGAQIHLAHLLKHFSKGNDVALMSVPGGWLNEEALKYGVKIYPNQYFSNSFNPLNLIKAERLIKNTVDGFKPDLICCHSSMAGFLGRLVVKGTIPTVYTAHGFAFTPAAPLWRRIAAIIGEKLVSKYTSKIICVSEFDKSLALKNNIAPVAKIAVVYNGVATTPEGVGVPTESVGKKKEPIEILNIGRLAYPKRPDLIVKAFGALPAELKKKAHLKIAGSGPYLKELNALINKLNLNESVSLSGEIDHQRILGMLPKADIFILITKHEGLPLTVLEAMSAGLPVIASRVGGIPEEIDAECGILIENNTEEKIAKALRRLIENPALRMAMGLSGRKRIEEKFSLNKFLSETEKIYKETRS